MDLTAIIKNWNLKIKIKNLERISILGHLTINYFFKNFILNRNKY